MADTKSIIETVKVRKIQFLAGAAGGSLFLFYAFKNQKDKKGWYLLGGSMVGLAVGYLLDKNARA